MTDMNTDRITEIHDIQGEYLQAYMGCFNQLCLLDRHFEELTDKEVVEYVKKVLTDTAVRLDKLGSE
jgi:hypothetical protein